MFTLNSTPYLGGGISNDGSSPDIVNCTFYGNDASQGGAIYSNSSTTIANSILWNDTPDEISFKGKPITVQYSNVKGGWSGRNNINASPMFTDTPYGDYHLQIGSLCIDSGSILSLLMDTIDLDGDLDTNESIPWDVEDNPRIAGNTVDMGAFESPFTRGHGR